jgi:hypothetical protein
MMAYAVENAEVAMYEVLAYPSVVDVPSKKTRRRFMPCSEITANQVGFHS